jgi:hypothetical protein
LRGGEKAFGAEVTAVMVPPCGILIAAIIICTISAARVPSLQ